MMDRQESYKMEKHTAQAFERFEKRITAILDRENNLRTAVHDMAAYIQFVAYGDPEEFNSAEILQTLIHDIEIIRWLDQDSVLAPAIPKTKGYFGNVSAMHLAKIKNA